MVRNLHQKNHSCLPVEIFTHLGLFVRRMQHHLCDLFDPLHRDAIPLLNRKRMVFIGNRELRPLPNRLCLNIHL